jgi:hypothetical protein
MMIGSATPFPCVAQSPIPYRRVGKPRLFLARDDRRVCNPLGGIEDVKTGTVPADSVEET